MKISKQDFALLKELEEGLWITEKRFDMGWMDEVLATDFIEIGQSSRLYQRQDTLAVPAQAIHSVIPLPDLDIRIIENNIAQVTYMSIVNYPEGQNKALRSSIWSRKDKGGWQLRFHQGTPLQSIEKRDNSNNHVLQKLEIRPLDGNDLERISATFLEIGWNKPLALYEKYLKEQEKGLRTVLVATIDGTFAGYITIRWQSNYSPFREAKIPEIEDFNVLPHYRKHGIGTALLHQAEKLVKESSPTVGIGVGMYPDYGSAQRLYVKMGYLPDGQGLTYKRRILKPLEEMVNDDHLVLYFIKDLTK